MTNMSELKALVDSLSIQSTSVSTSTAMSHPSSLPVTLAESKAAVGSFLQNDYPVQFRVVPIDFEDIPNEKVSVCSREEQENVSMQPSQQNDIDMSEYTGVEAYENSYTRYFDKSFYKFEKEIAKYPWQLVRYSWQGQPLLPIPVTNDPRFVIPPCSDCGARRVFEFQLMPTILASLSVEDPKYLKHLPCEAPSKPFDALGMDWATILVYNCEKDCFAYHASRIQYAHVLIINE